MSGRASIVLAALGGCTDLVVPQDRAKEARDVFRAVLADWDGTPAASRRVEVAPGDCSDHAFHVGLSIAVSRLNLVVTASASPGLMLHAGAAARPDGAAVVLCGESGSGKSTLTAGLVARGWYYVTDEITWIDPVTTELRAYRKPLSLKIGSQPLFPALAPVARDGGSVSGVANWTVAVDRLEHAAPPTGSLHPVALVFPTYRAGAGVSLEPMGPAEAAWRAGTQSSRLRDLEEPVVDVLARVARRAPAWQLVHDDHARALDLLEELAA